MVQTAPAEAYRKFDDLSKKHIDSLRGLTKNIQDARLNRCVYHRPPPPCEAARLSACYRL